MSLLIKFVTIRIVWIYNKINVVPIKSFFWRIEYVFGKHSTYNSILYYAINGSLPIDISDFKHIHYIIVF